MFQTAAHLPSALRALGVSLSVVAALASFPSVTSAGGSSHSIEKAVAAPSQAPGFVGARQLRRLVERSDVPVVVEFWASWCLPCRRMTQDLATTAIRLGDRAVVVRVDIDRDPFLGQDFDVQQLPVVLVFRHGELARRTTGLVGVDALVEAALTEPRPRKVARS